MIADLIKVKANRTGAGQEMSVLELTVPLGVALTFEGLNRAVEAIDGAMTVVDELADEDQLCDVWHAVDAIGSRAWQLRAKISYIIVEQTASQQGKADPDGAGRVAAIGRWAARLGCSSRTLWDDWRIFRTTLAPLLAANAAGSELGSGVLESLTDRGFYHVAAREDDPVLALENIASRKAENPFYGVQDARRDMGGEESVMLRVDRLDLARAAQALWARLGAAGVDELIAELLKIATDNESAEEGRRTGR